MMIENINKENEEDIIFGIEAIKGLLKGANKVYKSVGTTLGPKGKAVVILKDNGKYVITKDGVTVSKNVFPKNNKFEALGAQILKDVALKTNDLVGDGTTTATVIASAIINKGIKEIERGTNPVDISAGIKSILPSILKEIKDNTISGKDNEIISKVALVSSNNDIEISDIIVKAINEVGYDGILNFEKSPNEETYVKILKGAQIDNGYLDKAFITDEAKREVVMNKPIILIIDKKISNPSEIFTHLEYAATNKRPILFIADGVEHKVLDNIIENNNSGIQAVIIKAPGFDNSRRDELDDLSLLLNCKYLKSESQKEIETLDNSYYGYAEKVIITENKTSFEGFKSSKTKINKKINELKKARDNAKNKIIKDRYDERVAKFSGRADIYIGGYTDAEKKERYDRVEDAVNAVSNAINGGVVIGGGYTLFLISKKLKGKNIGENIVLESIIEPLNIIAKNAGKTPEYIKETCENINLGYNARINKFTDMKDILDPSNVTKAALESAISIASLFLLIDCVTLE